jgi:hypothetical protein
VIWRYWSLAQREAFVINLVGVFLGLAGWFDDPATPPVLPFAAIALSGYAIYLYRKIEKGER